MFVCQKRKAKRERETEKEKRRKKREKERVLSSRRACGFERMGGPSCELERSVSLTETVYACGTEMTQRVGSGVGGIRGKQMRVLKSTLRKPSLLSLCIQ